MRIAIIPIPNNLHEANLASSSCLSGVVSCIWHNFLQCK